MAFCRRANELNLESRGGTYSALGILEVIYDVNTFIRDTNSSTLSRQLGFPCALENVKILRINYCPSADHVFRNADHLIQSLMLPALQELRVTGLQDPERGGGNKDLFEIYVDMPVRQACAIHTLRLQQCNVPLSLIVMFLSMIQRDSLHHLHLTLSAEKSDDFVAQYRPQQLMLGLKAYARDLETLVLCANPAFMVHQIGHPVENEYRMMQGTALEYDFSHVTLSLEAHFLSDLPDLKSVTLDAHLLLDGYGIVQYIEACEWAPAGTTNRLQSWHEIDPDQAMWLVEVLPCALETLEIHTLKCQIRPLTSMLHDLLDVVTPHDAPARQPRLSVIKLFVGFLVEQGKEGEAYWSKEEGLTGRINGMFFQNRLIDGNGQRDEKTRHLQAVQAFHENDESVYA